MTATPVRAQPAPAQRPAPAIDESVKRMAVLAAAAALSTWAIDMAATQVGLPAIQAGLGLSVTSSQWVLNITLMLLAGFVTVGGALTRMRVSQNTEAHTALPTSTVTV